MKRRWFAPLVIAVVGVVIVGTVTWALRGRGTTETEAAQPVASLLVLEPGTEVLFELSRPVDPSDYPPARTLPDGTQYIPPPRPKDGKYWARSGLMLRWLGMGVVWATKNQVLYVAPDAPGVLDGLELYRAWFGDLVVDTSAKAAPVIERKPEAWLFVVTKGNSSLEARGMTPEQAGPDYWWGEGSVRLRIVSMRSKEQAGTDRGTPAWHGGSESTRNPDGSTEERPLYHDH